MKKKERKKDRKKKKKKKKAAKKKRNECVNKNKRFFFKNIYNYTLIHIRKKGNTHEKEI